MQTPHNTTAVPKLSTYREVERLAEAILKMLDRWRLNAEAREQKKFARRVRRQKREAA